jgi:hypothetical protein
MGKYREEIFYICWNSSLISRARVSCDTIVENVEIVLFIQFTVTNIHPIGRLLTVTHNERLLYHGNYNGSVD